MTQYEVIRESEWTRVDITAVQAAALAELGRKLAAQSEPADEESDPQMARKSIIECLRDTADAWRVLVREAVGIVSVGTLQISVVPKIPQAHFFYLASRAEIIPRVEEQETQAGAGKHLWELMAEWFVRGTERLIRRELTRGYTEMTDELDCVRGQILPIETATQCLLGRPVAECRFEEFSEDISLNRVIREAAERIASSPLLTTELRRRAKGVLSRMADVGRMQSSDMRVLTDRLTHRYREPLAFAKTIIRSIGPRVEHGGTLAWSFLLRTPDVMESGIRELLRQALKGITTLEKHPQPLSGSGMTLNPDLVFGGGRAVGDIKYKESSGEWLRSDLYQSVAFATGFRATRGCVIGFGTTEPPLKPPAVVVGDIGVSYFAYRAHEAVAPAEAAASLGSELRAWALAGLNVGTVNAKVA